MLILSGFMDSCDYHSSLSRRKDANSQHATHEVIQRDKSIKKEGC